MSEQGGALYAAAGGSPAAELARGFAWFWKLGSLRDDPHPSVVGFGGIEQSAELSRLVGAGELAGAVVTVLGAGPADGIVPGRRRIPGVPEFEGGTKVEGEFTIFTGGTSAVRSSLGIHAVLADGVLVLGYDPETEWGRLDSFWAYEAVAEYLESRIEQPLRKLPALGCLRLDDTPGTALHQMQERASTDKRQARRLRRLAKRLNRNDAALSLAVVAQALDDQGRRVPMDEAYPDSIKAIQGGIETGAYEPICHGLLHMDPDALERGEIQYMEFRDLDPVRAVDHLDRALEWQTRVLAAPRSFCAPAWSYGDTVDGEAAKRGLVRWYRSLPGPLLEDGRVRESLLGELQGLHKFDYSPLQRLAKLGIPPIVAMHGYTLDGRIQNLQANRDVLSLARLFFWRDISRLMALDGIEWVASSVLISALEGWGGSNPEAAPRSAA